MIRINRRSKTINKKRKKKRHEIYEWLESFVRGAKAGNFRGTRSMRTMRSLSRAAGSKQRRTEIGRTIDYRNSRACWSRRCC